MTEAVSCGLFQGNEFRKRYVNPEQVVSGTRLFLIWCLRTPCATHTEVTLSTHTNCTLTAECRVLKRWKREILWDVSPGLRRQNFWDHRGRAEKDTLCLSDRKSVFSMPGHKTALSPPTHVVFFTTKHMLFHITSVVNANANFPH